MSSYQVHVFLPSSKAPVVATGTDIALDGSRLSVRTPDVDTAEQWPLLNLDAALAAFVISDGPAPADLDAKTVVSMSLTNGVTLRPFLATRADVTGEGVPSFEFTDEPIQLVWLRADAAAAIKTQSYPAHAAAVDAAATEAAEAGE